MSTTLSETIEITIATTENPRVGPELARSWLLVNGAQPARFDAAANSAADVVVLDVEDSVAPADKAAARQHVIEWLSSHNENHELNHGWARINGFGTAWWEEDLRALREAPGLEGVMLAMTESPEHVTRTAEMLRGTRIVALVETARGVQNLQNIATARSTKGCPRASTNCPGPRTSCRNSRPTVVRSATAPTCPAWPVRARCWDWPPRSA